MTQKGSILGTRLFRALIISLNSESKQKYICFMSYHSNIYMYYDSKANEGPSFFEVRSLKRLVNRYILKIGIL